MKYFPTSPQMRGGPARNAWATSDGGRVGRGVEMFIIYQHLPRPLLNWGGEVDTQSYF